MSEASPPYVLESYRDDLHHLARHRLEPGLRAKLDPSDVVQLTMLEACRVKERLDGRSDAERRGWLGRVLGRNVAHARRDLGRARRDWRRERPLDSVPETARAFHGSALATEQSTPSQCAARKEREERLNGALAALPEAQRHAVSMHYLQGLSVSEVARRLGRSPAAVGGLLHRGLHQLRGRLDGLE